MPFFQKEPVVIEARQLTNDNIDAICYWINSSGKDRDCYRASSISGTVVIQTPDADQLATIGDWIIKGVKGEFYPLSSKLYLRNSGNSNPLTDIERDAARYRWIKAAPGLRIERMPDSYFWISTETGEKHPVTHELAAFYTVFRGLPTLDDLVDQAMEMYPINPQ